MLFDKYGFILIVKIGFIVLLFLLSVLLLTVVYVRFTERKTRTFYFTSYFNRITNYLPCFFKKMKWLIWNGLKAVFCRVFYATDEKKKNFVLLPDTKFYKLKIKFLPLSIKHYVFKKKRKCKSFSYYFSLDYLKKMPRDPKVVVTFDRKKDKVKKVPFFIFF